MDLRIIIHKCLEREPELRYQHAAALEEDLRRFLAGEPIRARRVSLLERVGRWSRRNKSLQALSRPWQWLSAFWRLVVPSWPHT